MFVETILIIGLIYQKTGDVKELKSTGKKLILLRKIQKFSNSYQILKLLEEIKKTSATNPVKASYSTIHRRIIASGLTYKHPISKPLLLKKHHIARLKFAKQNKSRTECWGLEGFEFCS